VLCNQGRARRSRLDSALSLRAGPTLRQAMVERRRAIRDWRAPFDAREGDLEIAAVRECFVDQLVSFSSSNRVQKALRARRGLSVNARQVDFRLGSIKCAQAASRKTADSANGFENIKVASFEVPAPCAGRVRVGAEKEALLMTTPVAAPVCPLPWRPPLCAFGAAPFALLYFGAQFVCGAHLAQLASVMVRKNSGHEKNREERPASMPPITPVPAEIRAPAPAPVENASGTSRDKRRATS